MDEQPFRGYYSETALHRPKKYQISRDAKSEPQLSVRKSHPLLNFTDDSIPVKYGELILAAETLENIVDEGSFVGPIRARMHGSTAILPYIDMLLVKTQYLVFNNQFLNHLGLVKVMLYDIMKDHFDYRKYPGIDLTLPDNSEREIFNQELVKDLNESLEHFKIKLGAAYARLRIETQAFGETPREQLENILPQNVREREDIAADMPKTVRMNMINTNRHLVFKRLNDLGDLENVIYVDDDFEDLLIVPGGLFGAIKASELVSSGLLVFQDKASMYGPKILEKLIRRGQTVIDAKAGCGTRVPMLSQLVGKKGAVICFENRPGRLETLKANVKLFGLTNVQVIESDFALCNVLDSRFAQASVVIVEPANSGTGVVDRLGYMLQEEEFPQESLNQKDLYSFKRQQVIPLVDYVLYMTRSTHVEENDQVIGETLDRYGVEWELDHLTDQSTLHIQPSLENGNGVFLGLFKRKTIHPPPEEEELEELTIEEIHEKHEKKRKPKQKMSKKVTESVERLSKKVTESVERLSIKTPQKQEKPKESRPSTSEHELPDMSVFGFSLAKFYAPKQEAEKVIKVKQVPNPKVWK
ncbi:S-adenosyl-L-methionine-dependent methyltransferase [Gorgonomyces haynaldii]|nr:S-adenosyl-L-methionine-dependent methyltransferase [Gorgonomyces haynaldii]